MRSKGLMMLLLAVIAGLVAVVLAARWMQQQGDKKFVIAVANADVERGQAISADQVHLVAWPESSIPQGAFKETDKLPGRVTITPLLKGEPILEAKLAPEGSKGGLSAVVSKGKRAMTVRVNDVIGVAGFALPGTFVDVMVNTQSAGSGDTRERAISKFVLERILVMAVAQEADRDANKPKVVTAVTLEVTPDEAEKLDLARSVGTLSLVLRNQTENSPTGTAGMTKSELLGMAPPEPVKPATAAAPAPAPRPVVVAAAPKPVVVAVPVAPVVTPSKDCVTLIRGMNKVTECF